MNLNDQRSTAPELRRAIAEAEDLINQAHYYDAYALLRRLTETEPQSEEARGLLESCLHKLRLSDGIDDLLREARLAFERGEWELAATNCRNILAVVPDHEKVRILLKDTDARRELRDSTIELKTKLVEAILVKDLQKAEYLCGALEDLNPAYPQLGEYRDKIALLKMRLEHFTRLVGEAEKKTEREEWDKALTIWESVLDLDPDCAAAVKAIRKIQKRLDDATREAWIERWMKIADQTFEKQDYHQAATYAQLALSIEVNHPNALKILQKAKEALSEERNVDELLRMADCCFRQEEFARCIDLWRTVLSITGDDQKINASIELARKLLDRSTEDPAASASDSAGIER